jgi:hypothetical protein
MFQQAAPTTANIVGNAALGRRLGHIQNLILWLVKNQAFAGFFLRRA